MNHPVEGLRMMLTLFYLYFQTYYILPLVFSGSNLQTVYKKSAKKYFQAPSVPDLKRVTYPTPRVTTMVDYFQIIQFQKFEIINPKKSVFRTIVLYQSVLQVCTKLGLFSGSWEHTIDHPDSSTTDELTRWR